MAFIPVARQTGMAGPIGVYYIRIWAMIFDHKKGEKLNHKSVIYC